MMRCVLGILLKFLEFVCAHLGMKVKRCYRATAPTASDTVSDIGLPRKLANLILTERCLANSSVASVCVCSFTLYCMNLVGGRFLKFEILILCLSVTGAVASCGAPQSRNYISYRIQPQSLGGRPALKVALNFKFQNRSGIDLLLPSDWQGATELYKSIHQISVTSAGALIHNSDSESRRHLSFRASESVSVEYLFQPEEQSLKSGVNFAPVLDSDYFVLTGRNFLVYPDVPERNSVPVSIEWANFPSDWALADSLGVGKECQQSDTLVKLSNGLFVGGDFRLQKSSVTESPVYLAIRGKWPFDDNTLAELAAKIITAERHFWNDRSLTSYLLVLSPVAAPPGEYAGTAVEGGFLMFMSPGTEFNFDVQFLFAHEAFHAWNPVQLGKPDIENPVYWFAEGFTDYYARLLLLRSSLINLQQYAEDINRVYSEYMSSPARNYIEQKVHNQYLEDQATQRLPYLQGTLLALKWNEAIDQGSHSQESLDNAMRLLRDKARVSDEALSDQNLGTFFSRFAGSAVASDIRDYIGSGETLPLPAGALGPCFELEKKALYTFDPGFDIDAMYRDGLIQRVEKQSEAYKAGLRDGQVVLRSTAINPNDTNQAVEMTLIDSGQTKSVRYFPRKTTTEIDQYQPVAQITSQCFPQNLN